MDFFGVLFSLLWVFTFFVLVFGFDASQRGVLQVLGWVDSTAWAARSRHKARTRVTAYVTLCNYTWIHTQHRQTKQGKRDGMGCGTGLCLVGWLGGQEFPGDNKSQYFGVWVSQPGGDKGLRMEDGKMGNISAVFFFLLLIMEMSRRHHAASLMLTGSGRLCSVWPNKLCSPLLRSSVSLLPALLVARVVFLGLVTW